MKVGVYLVDNIAPSAGGNFSYYDRFIRAIDKHQFSKPVEVCFTGRIPGSEVKLSKSYVELSSVSYDRFFKIFRKTGIANTLKTRLSFNVDHANKRDLKILGDNHIDLILFPKQFVRDLENFPFMTMNWDVAHKSAPSFPEFIEDYAVRDEWFRVYIQKGLAIIVESEASKTEFVKYYNIQPDKIHVVPLFPGGVVDFNVSAEEQARLLSKLQIQRLGYFFYPAQFWGHKNHYNLILAFKDFLDESGRRDIKLVLTGSDKGNKQYIRDLVKSMGLAENISILGFVSNEEMYSLYRNALALTMSTFLGPTNMPVLEAMALGVPVICSDLSGHRESCGDGALYAHPTDRTQWTKAMLSLLNADHRERMLEKSATVMATSAFNVENAVQQLDRIFLEYLPVRSAFK